MKLKKKEDQSVDTSILLERGTKHPWKELQRQHVEHLLGICPGVVLLGHQLVLCPILEGRNKTPMEGVTETKYGVETEGMTIQRLPHLGIHPIYSHQTQTLLWMPTSTC